ncbi:MAG: hypothetical protein IJY36_06430 [Coprobacter sp.]|nr:hypothetical protein [Coprobacter sp.]
MKNIVILLLVSFCFHASYAQQNKRWQDIYAKYYQIEDNETDIKYIRNWGIAVTSLSAVSYAVAMPAIALKMNNEAIDYATGKTDIDNVNKWSKKKTKAMAITSFVCGVGVLAGVSCLIYYHNNNAPGIAIADGLYIRDNGLGVSVTKTF